MIQDLFRFNCSTVFLLYPLGLSRVELSKLGLCNCYLKDPNHPEFDGLDVVLFLFEVKDQDRFRFFVNQEKVRTPCFIDEYDCEGGYVVLVYEIPAHFKEDFELFKKGMYSQLSPEFRKTVPDKVPVTVRGEKGMQHSLAWMVINQTEDWRIFLEETLGASFEEGKELWSLPDMEDETLTIPPRKIAPSK